MCRMHWYNLILDLVGPCHVNSPEGRLKFWNVRTVPRVRVEPHPLQDLQGIRCERQAPWLTLFLLWKGQQLSELFDGTWPTLCTDVFATFAVSLMMYDDVTFRLMILILLQKHAKAIVFFLIFFCMLANCTLYIAYSIYDALFNVGLHSLRRGQDTNKAITLE